MPSFGYLESLRRHEWRQMLKGLLPPGLVRLRAYLRNRSRFPQAFVSGDSCVDQGAQVGRGCVVRASHLGASVRLGDYSTLGEGCSLAGEGEIRVGRFCSIGPEVFVCSRGHRHLSRTTYPLALWLRGGGLSEAEHSAEPIRIGNDVWIGQRAIILAGAVIPDGCVVGAGSVVTRRRYAPYSIIAGVPASVRGQRLPQDEARELLARKWWDEDEQEIFGPLLDYLHGVPGEADPPAGA